MPVFQVAALSKQEAYGEKIRAALTRERAAIRDIYDVDYALSKGVISDSDQQLFALTAKKIQANGNSNFKIDAQRKRDLVLQVDTQLRSVALTGL